MAFYPKIIVFFYFLALYNAVSIVHFTQYLTSQKQTAFSQTVCLEYTYILIIYIVPHAKCALPIPHPILAFFPEILFHLPDKSQDRVLDNLPNAYLQL